MRNMIRTSEIPKPLTSIGNKMKFLKVKVRQLETTLYLKSG